MKYYNVSYVGQNKLHPYNQNCKAITLKKYTSLEV